MYTVTCSYCIGESAHVITSDYWDEVERHLLECQFLARVRDAAATGGADPPGLQGPM